MTSPQHFLQLPVHKTVVSDQRERVNDSEGLVGYSPPGRKVSDCDLGTKQQY